MCENERTIELTEVQRSTAKKLLERLDKGEIQQPEDIGMPWGSVYDQYDYDAIVEWAFSDRGGVESPTGVRKC